jgi:hypothetical protein
MSGMNDYFFLGFIAFGKFDRTALLKSQCTAALQ